MKQTIKLFITILAMAILPGTQASADSREEVTLTVSSDGATKEDALKTALRTAIEQAYGAFVSANTTILNDELIKDEIVTVSNGSIKDYTEVSSYEKTDGNGYMMTVNATVSLPHLITYAKNHGSECEFAGNTFGMDLKLFNLQRENELKALYNAIPKIEGIAKATMHWEMQVDEPKVIDYQFNHETKWNSECQKKMVAGVHRPLSGIRYKQAFGELITTDVHFNNGRDPFYFETDITRLLNKPIKRPDDVPSVEQDTEILNIMNEMPNGQYALVRFRLRWLPNEGSTGLSDYMKSLFKSLSIDHKTAETYRNQGHEVSSISGLRGLFLSDTYYSFQFRNSPSDIATWEDSVLTVIHKVKNDFEIIDNTGQVSSFNPSELSLWVHYHYITDFNIYNYISDEHRSAIYEKAPKLKYQYLHKFGSIHDWPTYNHHNETVHKLPNSNQKISTYVQHRHGDASNQVRDLISIGGEGLFHNVSRIEYLGEFNRPWDEYYSAWGEIDRKTTWTTYIFIPLSEIGKYSSFKVVSKEK